MYSDMSILTIDFSVLKRRSASALQSSVLPTPVGPMKRNDPIGRLGSESPARLLLIASDMAFTASSCPTTLLWSWSSMWRSFSFSPWSIFETGMPVALETTSAMSASVTLLWRSVSPFRSASLLCLSFFSRSGITPYCSLPISLRSPALCALWNSSIASSSSFLRSLEPESAAFSTFHLSLRA